MINRKLLLGAVLGASAFAAIPTAANAATCTYDAAKRTATVRYSASDTAVTVANAYYLKFGEAGGFMRDCSTPVRVSDLAKLEIKANSSATAPFQQVTTIDERQGNLVDGNPNLNTYVLTGTGADRIVDLKGGADDQVRLLGGPALGPNIDLNYDGHVDVMMSTSDDSVFEFHGGNGNDLLDGMSTTLTHVWAYGEGGDDVLVGTKRAKGGDYLDGGADNDYLYSYLNNAFDTVHGGSGVDKGTVEYGLDSYDGIENLTFG